MLQEPILPLAAGHLRGRTLTEEEIRRKGGGGGEGIGIYVTVGAGVSEQSFVHVLKTCLVL